MQLKELMRTLGFTTQNFHANILPLLKEANAVSDKTVTDHAAQRLIEFSQSRKALQRWSDAGLEQYDYTPLPVSFRSKGGGVAHIELEIARCNDCGRVWHDGFEEVVEVYEHTPDENGNYFQGTSRYMTAAHESKDACEQCAGI